MTNAASNILAYATSLPEGTTITAKELLQFGSRGTVGKVLSRLARKGNLLRIGAGLYTSPVYSVYGRGFPRLGLVVADVARRTGEVLAPPGIVSANRLSLTTQNPMGRFYLTSGKSRELTFKDLTVELRNAPTWKLIEPNSVPGHVIRGLDWMGKLHADEAIEKIDEMLTENDRRTVLSLRHRLPVWLAEKVSRLEK